MRFPTLAFRGLLLAAASTSVHAITVVEALRASSGTTIAQAAIAANPQWAAAGNKTLIVPTDAAITSARTAGFLPQNETGVVFLTTATNHRDSANYKILKASQTALLFDNYQPQGPPEIHVRSSTQQGLITANVDCDDGFFYVSNIPFETAVVPSRAIVLNPGATSFLALFTKYGLVRTLDSLTGVTIFVPTNDAIAAAQTRLAALTPNQVAYVLASHIIRPTKFSTEMETTNLIALTGASLPYVVAGESATVAGVAIGGLVDVPTSAGSILTVSAVIIPATLPPADANANAAVTTFGTVAVVGATTSTSATPTSTSPSSTSTMAAGTTTTLATSSTPTASSTSKVNAAQVTDDAKSGAGQLVGSLAGLLAAGAIGLAGGVL